MALAQRVRVRIVCSLQPNQQVCVGVCRCLYVCACVCVFSYFMIDFNWRELSKKKEMRAVCYEVLEFVIQAQRVSLLRFTASFAAGRRGGGTARGGGVQLLMSQARQMKFATHGQIIKCQS